MDLEKLSDNKLVSIMNNGSKEKAFSVLYKRYYNHLYNFSLSLLKNKLDAQDNVEDVFVNVITKINQYKSNNFKGWILTLTRNEAINKLRKNGSFYFNELNEAWSEIISCSEENFVEKKIKSETLNFINGLVEKLPEEQKQVTYMRFWQSKKFKEIEKETGIGGDTLRSRMRYALINLRKLYSESSNI